MTCNICCETYTKRDRIQVICPRVECKLECCSQCIRKYISESMVEPHCMGCKFTYESEFLYSYMTKTFMNTELKKKQSEIFLQLEKSLIPQTQQQAKEYMIEKQRKENIEKEINEVTQYYQPLIDKYTRLMQENTEIMANKIAKIHTKYNTRNLQKKEPRKTFMMKCQDENCNGYLSTSYKCELCEKYTCSKCFMIIDDNHQCKEENLKSAEMIRKDTKPCPNCATRIHKIEGCDQMWCTSCNNAFSWINGTIIHKNIHNPHYFDYIQNRNQGIRPRNPQDILCGGIPELQYLTSLTSNYRRKYPMINDVNFCIGKIQRLLLHIQYNYLEVHNEYNYETLRIKYIVKEINEEKWKSEITRIKKQEFRNNYERQMMDLIVQVGSDLLRNYTHFIDENKNKDEKFVIELYDYTKELLKSFINVIEYNNELKYKKCKSMNMSCVLFRFKIRDSEYNVIEKYKLDYIDKYGLMIDYNDVFISQQLLQEITIR